MMRALLLWTLMDIRRTRSPSGLSHKRTQGLSDFIRAWQEGDPDAADRLVPWLRREVRERLGRLIETDPAAALVDASQVVEATLGELTEASRDPRPRRAH